MKGKWKGLGFLAFDSVIFSQLVYMVGKGEGKGEGLDFYINFMAVVLPSKQQYESTAKAP